MTASSSREQSHIRHGSKVGRFVVVGELGKGGMGVVYAAHDRELDRQVALKVMRVASVEEVDRVRMLREGQAMARITHPNVITVFEVGSDDGVVFLAQELLDGGTLGEWLEKRGRTQEAILDKFVAAGRGLAAAHAVGLVHRDFKPENVLLGKDGRVRVADFGLAREVGGIEAALMATAQGGGPPIDDPHEQDSGALARNLTRTGVVMGTPMFMAPEQHEGKPADARSDQFAFCVALYNAVYGDWPYDGKTAVALADNVINGVRKTPPSSAKVSAHLKKTLLRGLSTRADDRFASMDELLAQLVKRPRSSKTLLMVLGGVLVVGAGAAASIAILGDKQPAVTAQKEPEVPVVATPVPMSTENREIDPRALTQALDLGQLENARRKFEDDAAFLQQDPVKASSAKSAAALMLVLRGDVMSAEAKLKEAEAQKGTDAIAAAYADMAASAIAGARGDLKTAVERGDRCATALATAAPIAASICHQLRGDAEADRGDPVAARKAYEAGTALAAEDAQRKAELALAIAQLDFDAKQDEVSLENITKLQKDARRRGAVSCEATAAVLASRIRLAKADPQGALDVFDDVDPDVLQAYRTKMVAKLTLGQLYGYRGEADENGVVGLERIDGVISDAKMRGFVGLELEARLARVLVKLITSDPEGETERAALIADATAKGYARVAKLAAAFNRDPMPAETPPPQ